MNARQIIDAEDPKKALRYLTADPDTWLEAQGFEKTTTTVRIPRPWPQEWPDSASEVVRAERWQKDTRLAKIKVSHYPDSTKAWHLTVWVLKPGEWREIECSDHSHFASVRRALNAYANISEAEDPKKALRNLQRQWAQSKVFTDSDFYDFCNAYIKTALWSSHSYDENGNQEDDDLQGYELAEETVKIMKADCHNFLSDVVTEQLWDYVKDKMSAAGCDFWLTRNHHGTGFWDGDWGGAEHNLTDLAHTYGSADLYVGDDGLVYQT